MVQRRHRGGADRRRRRTRPGGRGAADQRRHRAHPPRPVASVAHGPDHGAGARPLPEPGASALRSVRHGRRIGLGDVALSRRRVLILRFADVGVATYASLRTVGEPSETVTWMIDGTLVGDALDTLGEALPEPVAGESIADAVARALTAGPFAAPQTEAALAERLGSVLLSEPAWRLLVARVSTPRAVLFVSPPARLARVPWGLLALPAALAAAEACRLLELVDVLMAIPPNIGNAQRPRTAWAERRGRPALLILDPRVPG